MSIELAPVGLVVDGKFGASAVLRAKAMIHDPPEITVNVEAVARALDEVALRYPHGVVSAFHVDHFRGCIGRRSAIEGETLDDRVAGMRTIKIAVNDGAIVLECPGFFINYDGPISGLNGFGIPGRSLDYGGCALQRDVLGDA
jgi:hypothetical protein